MSARVWRTSAAAACLSLALVGCGTEKPSADEWGPIGPVESTGSPSGTPSESPSESPADDASETPAGDPVGETVALADLTADQAQLHSEILLFEALAQEQTGDGFGGGTYSFRDSESDFGSGMIRPEGITLADDYELTWADGKLEEYALATDEGLTMTWEAGQIHLFVPVGSATDQELQDLAVELESQVGTWRTTHGSFPSISGEIDTLALQTDLFDEDTSKTVEIAKPSSVRMEEYSGSGDDFSVILESDTSGEQAVLTQDGLTFAKPVAVS
ncbi:hypothetical protein IEQ44_15275 [Nocardioides sp. Y6]|uniref:LppX_LprAFG lipoprotein n=1 Tax=Nocardioides malaquae TaxID=2773426 RepID=A0ABR9RXX1_9ACTN|nr:hypothetical protein [Nocardioides malaquae]MBE7326010.1 hypothetical protein [Nocardioides malaquae]